MTALERLLREITPDDPISRSSEGLDDCCFWCGADGYENSRQISPPLPDGRTNLGARYVHAVDCAWVNARRVLGLPLTRPYPLPDAYAPLIWDEHVVAER